MYPSLQGFPDGSRSEKLEKYVMVTASCHNYPRELWSWVSGSVGKVFARKCRDRSLNVQVKLGAVAHICNGSTPMVK